MITLHPQYKTNINPKPSFKGLVPVSYVVLDGRIIEDEKIIDTVTKQLVKQIKTGKTEDLHLRETLRKVSQDLSLERTSHYVKKMGKYIITGIDAINLRNIWATNDSKQCKISKASNHVKNIFSRMAKDKLVIHANSSTSKGRINYVVNHIFQTVY